MRIIKTKECLTKLKEANALNPLLLEYLEEYFQSLFETFAEGEPEEEFSLDRYGYIVILESGDNTKDLSSVGLNSCESGLLGSNPEFVNKLYLPNKGVPQALEVYQTFVLFDNEYGQNFFSVAGTLDNETEAFLTENAID